MDSSTIAIVITVITIVSFILEKIPLAMTAMIASLAMGILVPEMKLSDIYSGFSSNNVIMVAGMCIVGDALFKTGMANKIGKALGKRWSFWPPALPVPSAVRAPWWVPPPSRPPTPF